MKRLCFSLLWLVGALLRGAFLTGVTTFVLALAGVDLSRKRTIFSFPNDTPLRYVNAISCRLLMLLILSLGKPNGVAQSQTTFNRLDDFGNGSVQTFVAERTGIYVGVSLVLFAHGTGTDVTVQLRKREFDGSLAPALLATGFVPASDISKSIAGWHYVLFDSPVNISVGASYGLALKEFEGASTGFVDYGSSSLNPYPNGRMMWENAPGQPLSLIFPDLDLAFENVVTVPEPRSFALFIFGAATFFCLGRCIRCRG